MSEATYDLIVIGSGPGGYVAAIRAAQLGFKVACVERAPTLGGTCLNVGCIPSKALLESSELFDEASHGFKAHGIQVTGLGLDLAAMLARKDKIVRGLVDGVAYLFKKNKIDWLRGTGRIAAPGQVSVTAADGAVGTYTTQRILIATGSAPVALRGVDFDGDRIVTSTEALAFPSVPEHLVVIGAGVIGLELGSVWRRLGAKVTVLEYLPRILAGMDDELASAAQKVFTKQGLSFELGARVTGATRDGERVTVRFSPAQGGEERSLECDRLLVCVGRAPYTTGLGLEEVGVALDERRRVKTDAHYQTNVPGIWAIGDVKDGPMLAHKAEEEGIAAVERMAGQAGHVNYDAIPGVVYTWPEIASVGKTEAELVQAGVAFQKGSFPFTVNGRAKAMGHTDGWVKILAETRSDRILGVHIIGPRAGDLIAELVVAIEMGASAEDVARSSHAHPSLAEVVKEAALAVGGRQIHL